MTPLLAQSGGPPGLDEIISQALAQLFKSYPWLVWPIIALLVVHLLVAIFKAATADESNFLWGLITWKTDSKTRRELRSALDEMIVSNRLFGLILLIVRHSLARHDRINHHIGGSTRYDGLQYLCDWIARATGFQAPDINKVVLFAPRDGELHVRANSGLSNEAARGIHLPIHAALPEGDTFAALAFRTGEIQVCHDVVTDPRYHQLAEAPAHQYKSILAVPVMRGESVIGCFTIDSLIERRFGPDEESQAKLFARLFALFMGDDGGAA